MKTPLLLAATLVPRPMLRHGGTPTPRLAGGGRGRARAGLGEGAERAHAARAGGAARVPSPSTRRRSPSSTRRTRSRARRCSAPTVYNFWKDERARARHLAAHDASTSYRTATPAWETVIDVDALGQGREQAVGLQGRRLPAARTTSAAWSRCPAAAADAKVVREFDTVTKAFVPGGFTLPGGEVVGRLAGRRHAVGRHGLRARIADRLGLPARRQGLEARDAAGRRRRRSSRAREKDVASYGITPVHRRQALRPRGARPRVLPAGDVPAPRRPPGRASPIPEDAELNGIFEDQVLFSLRTDWTVGGQDVPLAARCSPATSTGCSSGKPGLAGPVRADGAHLARRRRPTTKDRVLVLTLDNVRSRLASHTLDERERGRARRWRCPGRARRPSPRPATSPTCTSCRYEDFLTPTLAVAVDAGAAPQKVKTMPAFFDAATA